MLVRASLCSSFAIANELEAELKRLSEFEGAVLKIISDRLRETVAPIKTLLKNYEEALSACLESGLDAEDTADVIVELTAIHNSAAADSYADSEIAKIKALYTLESPMTYTQMRVKLVSAFVAGRESLKGV